MTGRSTEPIDDRPWADIVRRVPDPSAVPVSSIEEPSTGPAPTASIAAVGEGVAVKVTVVVPLHPSRSTSGSPEPVSDPSGGPIAVDEVNGARRPSDPIIVPASAHAPGVVTVPDGELALPATVSSPVAPLSVTPPGSLAVASVKVAIVELEHGVAGAPVSVADGSVTLTPDPVSSAGRFDDEGGDGLAERAGSSPRAGRRPRPAR